jgi:hypothetical protein
MWPSLAPIEACQGVSATPLASPGDVDAESPETILSGVRYGERAVSRAKDALSDQCVRQCNSQPSSQVVVAGTTRPEVTVADGLTKGAYLPCRSEDCESFHGSRHPRISDPVELLATHSLCRDQPTIEEVGEVTARRRGRHTRFPGELTGRVCAAIEQHVEHRRARGIADQAGHGGYVDVVLHVSILVESCRAYDGVASRERDRMEPIIAKDAREVASPQQSACPESVAGSVSAASQMRLGANVPYRGRRTR